MDNHLFGNVVPGWLDDNKECLTQVRLFASVVSPIDKLTSKTRVALTEENKGNRHIEEGLCRRSLWLPHSFKLFSCSLMKAVCQNALFMWYWMIYLSVLSVNNFSYVNVWTKLYWQPTGSAIWNCSAECVRNHDQAKQDLHSQRGVRGKVHRERLLLEVPHWHHTHRQATKWNNTGTYRRRQ